MSTTNNSYRQRRHYRTIFREGRYLLNTEGMELQLEAFQSLREMIKEVFKDSAVGDGFKVEVDPSDSARLILRPGKAFFDGYDIRIQSGQDHLVGLGRSPVELTSADFVKIDKTGLDDGGIALNFGGVSPVPNGTYSIVVELKEELITASSDPYLRSANLNEDTADKHRIILDINIVDSSLLDNSPIPYTGKAANNLVNYVDITRVGSLYNVISTASITGAEAIDGRNLEVIFNNGNGTTTAAFPKTNADLEEYIQGTLIDSNGTEFHITNMYVTPGSPNQTTMIIDLEKTRPVDPLTFQDEPVITDNVSYRLVKRELFTTTSASIPNGSKFFRIADATWGGTLFASSNIVDLRALVLAYDGVLDNIRARGFNLASEGSIHWNKDVESGYLEWASQLVLHSAFDTFNWTILAGNTFSLFGSALAQNEVLYVKLSEAPLGGALTLQKGVRGQGELTVDGIQAHKIVWIAKRLADDRVYFYNNTILNHEQTKPFYDLEPSDLVEDMLTLGYLSCYQEEMHDNSAVNPANTTGLFFANSYNLEYSNRVITVAVNNVTIPAACSFTVQVGDVISHMGEFATITNVNSQTDFDVDDGSVLSTGINANIGQAVETFNIRGVGDTAKERISTYITDPAQDFMVIYDDAISQITGNDIEIAFAGSADGGTTFTTAQERPESLIDFNNKIDFPVPGTDVRLKFFPTKQTGDGTAVLESFRVYLHEREFVGTIIPAVSQAPSIPGSPANTVPLPPIVNPQAYTLLGKRVVRVTPTGLDYADASVPAQAQAVVGVLNVDVLSLAYGVTIGFGYVGGALSGLGFVAGDEVYLGLNGQMVDQATAGLFPSGYSLKEIGVALSADDLWVHPGSTEILP